MFALIPEAERHVYRSGLVGSVVYVSISALFSDLMIDKTKQKSPQIFIVTKWIELE